MPGARNWVVTHSLIHSLTHSLTHSGVLQDVSRQKLEKDMKKKEKMTKKNDDEDDELNKAIEPMKEKEQYDFALPGMDTSAALTSIPMVHADNYDDESVVSYTDSVTRKVRYLLATGKSNESSRKSKPLRSSKNMLQLDENDNNSVSKHFNIWVNYQRQKQNGKSLTRLFTHSLTH